MRDPNSKGSDNKIVIICMVGVLYVVLIIFCMAMAKYEASLPTYIQKSFFDILLDTVEIIQDKGIFYGFPPQGNFLKYLLPFTGAIALFIFYMYIESTNGKHDMAGREHGSSKWNNKLKEYNMKYSDPIGEKHHLGKRNVILSDDLFMSIDSFLTQRNLNILYVGGSGTGKSRFGVKPNVLCANTSYLITDPSAELLESLGKTMRMLGFKIKIFNLVDMEDSNHYNPFDYIEKNDQTTKEKDVMKMVDCLLANTSDPNAAKEAFWEDSMKALFLAICYLLIDFEEEENINFTNVLKYIQMGRLDDNVKGPVKTPLDIKFENAKKKEEREIELGIRNYQSKAFTNYDTFKLAGVKTAQSILISASVRINKFSNTSVAKLTQTDFANPENNVNLQEIGNEPTCFFVIIPTADNTFNFLVSMMYSQFFEINYYKCETMNPKKFLIKATNGTPIKTMIDTEEEAYDILDLYYKKAQVKKVERIERLMNNKSSEELIRKKNEAKRRKEEQERIKNKGKKVKITKSKSIKKDYDGKYTCYQVVIPFEPLPDEELKKLSFQDKIKYIEEQKKGDTVIREFYSETMANEFLESIKTAEVEKGRIGCPWQVRLELDEFANIGTIPQLSERVATMRKYGISVNIILQNLKQLEKNYKESFADIKGNCDINILLGTSEIETAKEYSELLGDATITVKSRSRNLGKNGGASNSFQQSGRKLLDPAEITKMDNRYSIVRVRGEEPFFTKKFEYTKHPNYHLTGDYDDVNQFDEEYKEVFFMELRQGQDYVVSLKESAVPFDEKDAALLPEEKIGKTQLTKDVDQHLYELNVSRIEDIPSVLVPIQTVDDDNSLDMTAENVIGEIKETESIREVGREQMKNAGAMLDMFSETIINNDMSNSHFYISEQLK